MTKKTRKFSDLTEPIQQDPHRRAEIARHKQAIYEALRLAELRGARDLTQTDIAKRLGVTQTNISQLEHRSENEDIYISTLHKYITALGGQLELHAVFPDQTIPLKPPNPETCS